jgi:hypothetical protein
MNQQNRRIEIGIPVALSVGAISLLGAASCTDKRHDCTWLANCAVAAGGEDSSAADAGGQVNSAAGAAADPCAGKCPTARPICKTTSSPPACVQCTTSAQCTGSKRVCDSTGTCQQCLTNDDCGDPTPACSPSTKTCVACLASIDCKTAEASRCETSTHSCVACQADADCSQIAGKTICAVDPQSKQNQCFECTLGKEAGCLKEGKDYACNPASNQCTATEKGKLEVCQACLADSECLGGNLPEPAARCVPTTFGTNGQPHGSYCLQRVGPSGCTVPYSVSISAVSTSGAPLEPYCGINQATTTCEAVRDMVGGTACETDANCGAGQGGLCQRISVVTPFVRCTIPCSMATQCPDVFTCTSPSVPWCHP